MVARFGTAEYGLHKVGRHIIYLMQFGEVNRLSLEETILARIAYARARRMERYVSVYDISFASLTFYDADLFEQALAEPLLERQIIISPQLMSWMEGGMSTHIRSNSIDVVTTLDRALDLAFIAQARLLQSC